MRKILKYAERILLWTFSIVGFAWAAASLTSQVINDSNVTGSTAADALNTLWGYTASPVCTSPVVCQNNLDGTWGWSLSSTTGSGAVVLGGSPAITTPSITGITSGGSVCSGCVGQNGLTTLLVGSAVSFTVSGSAYNVTSVSLTAGSYLVGGVSDFTGSATSVTYCAGWLTTSSTPSLPAHYLYNDWLGRSGAFSVDPGFNVPTQLISQNATFTLYLDGQCSFSGGTASGYGAIWWLRIA